NRTNQPAGDSRRSFIKKTAAVTAAAGQTHDFHPEGRGEGPSRAAVSRVFAPG
ncbi:MAG TPA: hypothetical protein DEH78_16555, partial [Solibacterales bacterium]|nr:hypothetical protein [Bryobacterales bacterium]